MRRSMLVSACVSVIQAVQILIIPSSLTSALIACIADEEDDIIARIANAGEQINSIGHHRC